MHIAAFRRNCSSICEIFWGLAFISLISGLPGVTNAEAPHVATRTETSVADCLRSKQIPFLTASNTSYANYSSPYNVRLRYEPLVIVLAETNAQVSGSVLCATKYNLKIQAKSGGHSYASYSTGGKDGAFVIDLQKFQTVSFDEKTNIATFGAGLRLGNLAMALHSYGRALPHGTCTGVGVGGHFTVGGDGFTARAHGLAIDSLVAMDVILANGSIIHATPTTYPDVFFAMRGAGNSFGIATTFYGQTFEQPTVLTGIYLTYPGLGADAAALLSALTHLQNFANNASSGLDRQLQFDINVDSSGTFQVKGVYLGPTQKFNETVLPELIRGLPKPSSDKSDPSFVKQYGWTDALIDANYGGQIAYPKPGDPDFVPTPAQDNYYTKSLILPLLPAQALKNLARWAEAKVVNPPVGWYFTLSLQGGYDSQIFLESKQAGAAFFRRNATWVMENSGYPDDLETAFPAAGIRLVDDMTMQVTGPLIKGTYGAYQGYVDSQMSAEAAGTMYYGTTLFSKLKTLKKKIDPENVFWNPQSIPVGN